MKKILVIRFSAFGDVIMSYHLLKSFLEENNDYELIFLTKPFFGKLFFNEKKIILPIVDFKKKHKGFAGLVRLADELSEIYEFDYVLDLHNVLRTKILRFLFSLKGKKTFVINKGRKEKKNLVKKGWTKSVPLKHTVERYAEVFRKAGFRLNTIKQHLFKTNCNLPEKLQTEGIIIGIAPFAKHKTKIYPLEKTEHLILKLNKDFKILIFGGGENEKKMAEEWEEKYENVFSVIGKTNLECEIQLIDLCKAFVSMDSANMHLATLTNVPLISIWGGTHPYAGFSPFKTEGINIFIQSETECRPCSVFGKSYCKRGDFRCMTSIDENIIIDAIKKAVNSNIYTNSQ